MDIRVDCYAGYRDEETPRRLTMGTRQVSVVSVQDRWLAPDHRYFKLIGDDGSLYIIRHDPHQGGWQLIFFRDRPLKPSPAPRKASFCSNDQRANSRRSSRH